MACASLAPLYGGQGQGSPKEVSWQIVVNPVGWAIREPLLASSLLSGLLVLQLVSQAVRLGLVAPGVVELHQLL
jgi:hypothetical protein